MKTAGIIAEYNPFHSGHAYHIARTRELGYTHICAVMSENAVQRGDIAILDAHSRAKAAISGGADLVIGLMPPYSIGSARDFASAGVSILKGLGAVDAISFGAETDDTRTLCRCAEYLEKINKDELKHLMSAGLTYPQALTKALNQLGDGFGEILSQPNNVLALEYIRELKDSGISPIAIKRTAAHDGLTPSGAYASASYLREKMLSGGDVGDFLGYEYDRADVSGMERIEGAILWQMAMASSEEILSAPYTGGGIGQRIIKNAMTVRNLGALFDAAMTRNVTHARVRRAVLAISLGITAEDVQTPPYARVLAANARGLEILAECKRRASIPISTSLADLSKVSEHARRCAQLSERASRLRFLARKNTADEVYVSEMARKSLILK